MGNAIPREATATGVVMDYTVLEALDLAKEEIMDEFAISDSKLVIEVEKTSLPEEVMSLDDTIMVIQSIYAVHNGVYRMSMAIPGLVETSSSLARVIVKDGEFKTMSLQRSSVESSKYAIAHTIGSVFRLAGCEVEHTG